MVDWLHSSITASPLLSERHRLAVKLLCGDAGLEMSGGLAGRRAKYLVPSRSWGI